MLHHIIHNQEDLMALGQELLDAVTAAKTRVESLITLLDGLVANNTIDAATAQKIKDTIAGQETEVEAAIAANTTPPPTP